MEGHGVEATDIIRGASRITAICHENPDADTIGAAVGVALMARQLGKAAEVVSVDHLAPMFDYLDESRRVHRRPELAPDLAVVCDAASLERVGRIVDDEAEWFLLRELGPNETRVSIRTAGEVNAATLAATYGGGGHARRAGCTIGMPLQRAVEHVLGSAHSALR